MVHGVDFTKYQALIHITLQQCNLIIDKHKIKQLIQKKPSPPTLKAQLKLHTPDNPIRPVINSMNAPIYKLAKHLVKLLNTHLTLKNYYNVTNSTNLATELTHLVINKNYRLITYDIEDLSVNISIEEVIGITKSMLAKNNYIQTTKQIINLMRLVLL